MADIADPGMADRPGKWQQATQYTSFDERVRARDSVARTTCNGIIGTLNAEKTHGRKNLAELDFVAAVTAAILFWRCL
jgi:hypothetical protein